MVPSRKLAILAAVFVAAVVYVAYLGATSGWQYYLTAEECLQRGPSLVNFRVRVSGKVASGSLATAPDRFHSTFALQAGSARLLVACNSPLPEQLAEGKDVVVEGRVVTPGSLAADRVITRCATKYQSKGPLGETKNPSAHPTEVSR
jgi:cytochrome c-type biogenesis protein CcmE